MKKIITAVPKIIFAVLCYVSALLLALLSGYFTVVFYSTSQAGWNMYAMAGLAGMLELIKIMLAVSYPFMQYRDKKREKKVLFYLKICFFLSIMASLNFFLTGGVIERSPASNITALIYDYIPVLNIVPLKFMQFLTTMSLSILVEAFIVFLPMLAPIMFLEKVYDRKFKATTNFEKLKEIPTHLINNFIDSLYRKVVEENNTKVVEITEQNKLENNSPKLVGDKPVEDKNEIKHITEDINESDFVQDKVSKIEKKQIRKKREFYNRIMNQFESEKKQNSAAGQITQIENDENIENRQINGLSLPWDKVLEFLNFIIQTAKKIDGQDMQILSEKDLLLKGFSRDEIEKYKNELKLKGYLYVKNKKTYLKMSMIKELEEQECL